MPKALPTRELDESHRRYIPFKHILPHHGAATCLDIISLRSSQEIPQQVYSSFSRIMAPAHQKPPG